MDHNYSKVLEEKKWLDRVSFDTVTKNGVKYITSKEVRRVLSIYVDSISYRGSIMHRYKSEHDIYDYVNQSNYTVKYDEFVPFFKKKCRNKIVSYYEKQNKGIIDKPLSGAYNATPMGTSNNSLLDILKIEPQLRFLLTNEVKRNNTPLPTILSNVINKYLKDKLAEIELY